MVDPPPSVGEVRFDIVNLEIGHFLDDLIQAQSGSEQIENVADPFFAFLSCRGVRRIASS
jgi:hypothetical protein